MLPAWRPDKAMAIENTEAYRAYIDKLGASAGRNISSYNDLLDVLQQRHDFFASQGCRLSDHGINEFYAEEFTESEIKQIFQKVISGKQATAEEVDKFRSALLLEFARQDAKTILYCLNPSDNEMIATMLGNFQEGPTPGKIQFGSGWWFNDQLDGMERQMNALSVLGLLSRFVGMLTDSRSFLSYPRHEYFRRQLCNMIGQDVEDGKLPAEGMPFIEQMVRDISYYNAKRYFNF